MKLHGPKSEALGLFGAQTSESNEGEQKQAAVKSTFKIEINDEDKKIRDTQQTTVYHTGQSQQSTGPLIELDEEDLKEIEKTRLAQIDEEGGSENEDDDDGGDDPDEDLNF